MISSIGIRNAILIEIIAYRQFTTKRIAATFYVHLIIIIIFGLNQDWNSQFGVFEGINYTKLIAEIRKCNNNTIYNITILTEQFSTLSRIMNSFDGSGRCCFDR